MKKVILSVLFILLVSFISNAQPDLNKKLKDIKGKVDEIIIKSEGKEYKFNGDDAQKLFASIKQNQKMKHFAFWGEDGEKTNLDSLINDSHFNWKEMDDSDSDIMVLMNEDNCDSIINVPEKNSKKITVTDEGGKKVVTIVTNENGEENIDVYEGKTADECLQKMKNEKELNMNCNSDKDSNCKKSKKIIIKKEYKSESYL
jgi:hypothetical protein